MRKNILRTIGIGATVLMILIALSPLISCQPSQDISVEPPKEKQTLSCFPAGTKITMADGTYKNIEEVQIGEPVLSYNLKSNQFTTWTVKNIAKPRHPVWEINNGLIRMTDDHPLRIKKSDDQEGWGVINVEEGKEATRIDDEIVQLEKGDQLFTEEGKWIEIYAISFSTELVKTYDLISLSGRRTYFANGILVHEENPDIDWWINLFINRFFNRHPNAFPLLRYLLQL